MFISSLLEIARAVEESASVNVAELAGLHNGTVRIQNFDWVTYLGQYFKKITQIKNTTTLDSIKNIRKGLLYAVSGLGKKGS